MAFIHSGYTARKHTGSSVSDAHNVVVFHALKYLQCFLPPPALLTRGTQYVEGVDIRPQAVSQKICVMSMSSTPPARASCGLLVTGSPRRRKGVVTKIFVTQCFRVYKIEGDFYFNIIKY